MRAHRNPLHRAKLSRFATSRPEGKRDISVIGYEGREMVIPDQLSRRATTLIDHANELHKIVGKLGDQVVHGHAKGLRAHAGELGYLTSALRWRGRPRRGTGSRRAYRSRYPICATTRWRCQGYWPTRSPRWSRRPRPYTCTGAAVEVLIRDIKAVTAT